MFFALICLGKLSMLVGLLLNETVRIIKRTFKKQLNKPSLYGQNNKNTMAFPHIDINSPGEHLNRLPNAS